MPKSPEERIAELAPSWGWGVRHCIATDPIWMEFVIEQGDPAAQKQLSALRLETVAAVYRAISDAAGKAAAIVAKSSGR